MLNGYGDRGLCGGCKLSNCYSDALTRSKASSPLVSNLVKNRLFMTAPDIDQP